jgi:tRNA(Arg) A34 adenosine deaminase TadA
MSVPDLDHARFMRLAIDQAKKVPQLPFGAVLVDSRDGTVLAEGHNRSAESPTFHGEIDVIDRLAASPRRPEDWMPLVLYTTAEPCPMCQSAIAWAGIGATVFGSSIPFLKELGWWQIDIRAEEVVRRTPFRRTALLGGVLREECDALFVAVPRGQFREKK